MTTHATPINPYSVNPYSLKEGEESTGTTIMAIPFEGGVVLGADTRTSMGSYATSRSTDKITLLSDHIFCLRSGSAADTQAISDIVKHYLSHLTIETGRQPLVKQAAHLMRNICYKNKGSLSAGVIVAGWDSVAGGQVFNVVMGGSCLKQNFALGGSGSLFIYGLLDSEFRAGMAEEEARNLVKKCVAHAMARDGSSGGMVRTMTVTAEGNRRDVTNGNQLMFGPVF